MKNYFLDRGNKMKDEIAKQNQAELAKFGFIKKKFFWTLDFQSEEMVSYDFNGYKTIFTKFGKPSGRPTLNIEEVVLPDQEKMIVPGKSSWQDIYFKMCLEPEELKEFEKILQQTRRLIVNMWDGCGGKLEEWHLTHLNLEFTTTELDYSCSDVVTNLKIGYKDARYYNAMLYSSANIIPSIVV